MSPIAETVTAGTPSEGAVSGGRRTRTPHLEAPLSTTARAGAGGSDGAGGQGVDEGSVLSARAAWVLLGALYAAAGLLVGLTTFVPAAAPQRVAWVVRAMDGAAVVCAVLQLCLARRLPRGLLGPVVSASSVLIAVCVLVSGGHSTAVAYACVFFVGPVYARFVMSPRQADAQLLLVLLLGVPALAVQPGVTVGEQVVVWGIALMQSGATRWLVSALARAETDALTGLPHHRGLERHLEEALVGAPDGSVGLVLLDLGDAPAAGGAGARSEHDQLLLDLTSAWRSLLPRDAVLGRTSRSVFAVVVPRSTLEDAGALARAMVAAPPAALGCVAGVVAWERGEEGAVLLQRAESAVLTAGRLGAGSVYEHPGTGREGAELRRALEQDELVVHFQPVVDLVTGDVVGAEALVRWDHPERGLLLPGAFLDEVERCGLAARLGERVLDLALTSAARWPRNARGEDLHVAVNASGPELLDPGYAATVAEALMRSGLPAARLVVELVEDDYDATSAALVQNLAALRQLGVRTAVDDFGTGHSSLERLRQTGGALLKIDRSFVQDVRSAEQEAPLVLAVIALGRALGMRVVAEGVETAAQATWLREHGCAFAQGWRFGAAQPQEAFCRSVDVVHAIASGAGGTGGGPSQRRPRNDAE